MYKPNTVIRIAYDPKQISNVYMLDVTSKNFYTHVDNFFELNTTNILTYLCIVVHVIMAFFVGTPRQPSTRLYLDDPSSNFKILMIVIGVLMGILMFLVLRKKNQGLHIEEYLDKYPYSEKITEKDEVDEIMNRAQIRAALIMVGTIGLPIWSIFTYRQFWNYNNFGTYLWATLIFIIAAATASLWKNVRFLLKLYAEMYATPKTPKVSEKSTPKKHPWEEEKQDENKVWKAKMLKLESEMNENKE